MLICEEREHQWVEGKREENRPTEIFKQHYTFKGEIIVLKGTHEAGQDLGEIHFP